MKMKEPTTLDQQKQKLEQRQAKLDKARALLKEKERRQRTSMLIALGLLVEREYLASESFRKYLWQAAERHFGGKTSPQDIRTAKLLLEVFTKIEAKK